MLKCFCVDNDMTKFCGDTGFVLTVFCVDSDMSKFCGDTCFVLTMTWQIFVVTQVLC